jgi:exonuclease SbcC
LLKMNLKSATMNSNQYLEKIQLSNIRRLGPDLEIDFGKGATVLLAPNGTGKSTIFQAIELALTHGVRLLDGVSLDVLVRENTETALVDLVFNNELTCSARYENKNWSYSPPPLGLFPSMDGSDLPFALKLTHFLDQADSKWIVRLESDEAGEHVNRLSIAKDANRANAKLTSAKKQGNKRLEEAEHALDEAKKIQSRWQELQIRLAASSPKSTEALISFRDGNESIQELTDVLRLPKFPEANEINSLRSNWAVVSSTCNQRLESARTRLVTLNALKTEIPYFFTTPSTIGNTCWRID